MLTLIAALLCRGTLAAQDTALTKTEIQDRAVRASAWVVALSLRESGRTTTGTAFLVDARARLVVTNAHVVGDKKQVRVMFPWYRGGQAATERKFYGREMPLEGTVVAVDPKRDLALIQVPNVPNAIRPLRLADGGVAMENVYIVGNPGDDDRLWRTNEATIKRVAARDVPIQGAAPVTGAVILNLEARKEVHKGVSGGPVLNQRGELVGMVFAAGTEDAHRAFAVDVREVRDVLILARDHPSRAQAVLTPRRPADWRDRGSYYLSREQYDRALAAYSEAIRLEPQYAAAYADRSRAYAAKGDADKAKSDWQKAVQIDPSLEKP
jgi:S1-C subfamily serine protease